VNSNLYPQLWVYEPGVVPSLTPSPQFSIILQQLFESYNSMVSTGNSEELCRTVLAWFEQNCTLPSLRPGEDVYIEDNNLGILPIKKPALLS